MPIIELPDGNEAEFPDDLPMAELKKAVNRYWVQQTKGPMSRGERFAYGMGNVAYGMAQMAARVLPKEARGIAARPIEDLEKNIKERSTEYEARKPEGTDYSRMAGEIAATLPLALLPGATGVVAGGAIAGMAHPEVDTQDGYWSAKAGEAVMGAAGATAGAVGGRILGAVFGGAKNVTARALAKEGVEMTPAQAIGPRMALVEEKLTSVPGLGGSIARARQQGIESANVAIYNRALAPIGKKSSGTVGPEGVAEVHQALSSAYDDIAPKLQIRLDELMGDVGKAVDEASAYLPEAKVGDFSKKLATARGFGNFKEAERYLDFFATKYKASPNPDDQLLGDAFENVIGAARDSLAKQNPAYASRLRQINEGWKGYSIIRDAALSAEKAGRDAFSPEELNRAVARSAEKGGWAGRAAFTENRAFMQDLSRPMLKVLGRKYPDSGTAGRIMEASILGLGAGAATAPMALAYRSHLLRRAATAAILKRPPGAELAGRAVAAVGRGAAPGTGLALAEAGAAAASEPDEFWNSRTAGGTLP